MIVYELRCGSGHGFEAWFRNSDAYDQQRAAQQVSCPVCDGTEISKAPMAPRIGKGLAVRESPEPATSPTPAPSPAPAMPHPAQMDQMRVVMSKIAELNRHIADTCDYVGAAFPEEARKIHYGETPRREIYGEATRAEAEELHEEGITVAAIPWLKRTDS